MCQFMLILHHINRLRRDVFKDTFNDDKYRHHSDEKISRAQNKTFLSDVKEEIGLRPLVAFFFQVIILHISIFDPCLLK